LLTKSGQLNNERKGYKAVGGDLMKELIKMSLDLLVGLVAIIFIMRLIGRKELAQVTPLDMVYVLVLGGIVEETAIDPKKGISYLLTGLFVFTAAIWLFEKAALKIKVIQRASKGKAEVLIENGNINWHIAKHAHLDKEQIMMLLRMKNTWSIEEVKLGILEPDGTISVKKEE
jgi:uncharacterized membrane protein YcaP (DUF421 family)